MKYWIYKYTKLLYTYVYNDYEADFVSELLQGFFFNKIFKGHALYFTWNAVGFWQL